MDRSDAIKHGGMESRLALKVEGTMYVTEGLMLEDNMFVDCCCSVFLSLYLFVLCVTLGVSCRHSFNSCNPVLFHSGNVGGGATMTVGGCIGIIV